MSKIKDNIEYVKLRTEGFDYTLIAATKYVSVNEMHELYENGITHFGENRVDSFLDKYDNLCKEDVKWHFIGTLQTKKVKQVINKIDVLHSVDRFTIIDEINCRANKAIDCFVQFNISNEDTKSGFSENDIPMLIDKLKDSKLNVIGLMGMASNTEDEQEIRNQFLSLQKYREILYNSGITNCKKLSIGMSNDYMIALSCGATHIRLGSILFK